MSKPMPKLTDAERAANLAEYEAANARADALVKPIPVAKWSADYDWCRIEGGLEYFAQNYGGVNLVPDFQRGHVWTGEQKSRFIENILRGVVTEAGLVVQFNCPQWDDHEYNGELPREIQCVDGLQRLTAVREYVAGKVLAFGQPVSYFENTRYAARRSLFRLRFAMHCFATRQELLNYYLDINGGGTPHSPAELARVRGLMEGR